MKTKTVKTKRLKIPGNDESFSNREILTKFLKQFRQKLGYYSMLTALPAILTSHAQAGQSGEEKKTETSVAGRSARLVENLNKSCNGKPEFLRSQSNYLLPHQKGKYSNIISELTGGDNCPGTAIPPGIYTAAAPFTDSGNTTGANDTVTNQSCYFSYYGYNSSSGPDQIYTFTLTGRGANPQIQVSTTSSSYNPQIYILSGSTGASCPAGTGNRVSNCQIMSETFLSGGTETISSADINSLPLNIPLYLFIDSIFFSGPNSAGPYTLRIQDVTIAQSALPRTQFDFDGDSKADISVFRPSAGFWHLNRSSQGAISTQFGLSTDKIVPADYDGDGRTDIAVYRDGFWYWLSSSNGNFNAVQFGLAADLPVPADFTGDGRAELAVYREGNWYTLNLANGQFQAVRFGLSTDKPAVGDYDGDGLADIAVYRDGTWYLLRSQQGFAAIQFGLPSDKLVPADYDGDGKTDIAVFRDGIWYLLQSTSGFTGFQFGLATDTPAPADYDGDFKADAAVFRDGNWFLLRSTSGFSAAQLGQAGDKSVPNAFVR